jgi:uncharacterized protein YdhG (YjbR/CyaY superfamily)
MRDGPLRLSGIRRLRGARARIVRRVGAVDDYLDGLDEAARSAFERIRHVATEVEPSVGQGTSYGLAALTYQGRPLLGFRVARQHLSIFPFSAAVVDGVRDRLPGFDLSKGTIRFTAEKPLPDEAVREVVRLRVAELDGG